MENENASKAENKAENSIATIPEQNTNPALMPTYDNDFQFYAALANQLENLSKIASVFVKGGLCPIKREEDFIVATVTGQQLGLPMTTAINNIFVVNNKPALATHLMRALLLKAGIIFNKVADFEPVFAYYEAEELEGKLVAKKLNGVPIQRGVAVLAEIDETKFVAGRKEVDRITKYVFERKLKQADGSYKDMKVVSTFSMVDAIKADLQDKDNYKKYPARMLDARAFAIGSREIASDVLFGMYTIAEMADANNIQYTMSESFEEAIVDAEVV